jgi:hypothetical protein
MSEQGSPKGRKDWSGGVISQRTLTVILAVPCLCLCAFCIAAIAASECPVDDFFYRGFLRAKPIVPLPDHTVTELSGDTQGSHGGWTGGLYATTESPEEVLAFYRRSGGSCDVSANTIYQLGGFKLDVQSPYWECDVPAKPWSRGAVTVFPQAGYINALKTIYNNPPQLSSSLTISETVVGAELRQFYGQAPFPDTAWLEGGAILRTSAGWCDPF